VLVNEQASAVSADANVGEGADLILGQRDVHRVALDPGDGPDRDSDLFRRATAATVRVAAAPPI
jgi:hypothetical protein